MTSRMDYVIQDEPSGKVIVGHFPREVLESQAFPWFNAGYRDYEVKDPEALSAIQAISDRVEVLVFLGTWCHDTHHHLPSFIKILDLAHVPPPRVVFVGLDRSKHLGTITSQFRIEKLPTFVVLSGGQEVGRIVEAPSVGLIEDLALMAAQIPRG